MNSSKKIDKDGTVRWYLNGTDILHREDGPAVERFNGTKEWYQDGKLHRLDGPALQYSDGNKVWYQNDKLHRLDGPAIEYYANGNKVWYYEGKQINCSSQEEFKRIIRLKAFL